MIREGVMVVMVAAATVTVEIWVVGIWVVGIWVVEASRSDSLGR